MSRFALGVVALAAFSGLMAAANAVPKKTTHSTLSKSGVPSAAKNKTTGRLPASQTAAAKSTRRSKAKGRQTAARRSNVAPQPSAERYQQIQRALVEKGYYKGEPNGQWGADSVDALKRFQSDQNLTSDGKLNSLSLIALGLGPKRITTQAGPAPVKPQRAAATPISPEPGARQ